MCLHAGVHVCVPTTLFITVVPAIIVAVTVPEAANTVAILAVKLIFFTLSGSCGDKNKEKGLRGQIMRIQQKQRYCTRIR